MYDVGVKRWLKIIRLVNMHKHLGHALAQSSLAAVRLRAFSWLLTFTSYVFEMIHMFSYRKDSGKFQDPLSLSSAYLFLNLQHSPQQTGTDLEQLFKDYTRTENGDDVHHQPDRESAFQKDPVCLQKVENQKIAQVKVCVG